MIRAMKIKDKEYKDGITFQFSRTRRPPLANGHLGRAGYLLPLLEVTRLTPLNEDGSVDLDESILKLFEATGQNAYFGGELTLAYPSDPGTIVLKLSWKTGHICEHEYEPSEDGILERFTLSVTDLTVNNCKFRSLQKAA
jgi:hypothetical protein